MIFAISYITILLLLCASFSSCSFTSQGTYFAEISENGDGKDNSDSFSRELTTTRFHQCSLKPDCNFLLMDIKTNTYTQISSEEDLPEERHRSKIWKKIVPKGGVYESCQSAKALGSNLDGVITINQGNGATKEAYCDMRTNGGGWIVLLRRVNNATSFDNGWFKYVDGFGELDGDFWFGLEAIHMITKNKNFTLRIELKDVNGSMGFAQYTDFSLSGNDTEFVLNIGNYIGNIGNSLNQSNGFPFTTKDNDNDSHKENCAVLHGGPWWYRASSATRLMSLFPWETVELSKALKWETWREKGEIVYAEMKMREAVHDSV